MDGMMSRRCVLVRGTQLIASTVLSHLALPAVRAQASTDLRQAIEKVLGPITSLATLRNEGGDRAALADALLTAYQYKVGHLADPTDPENWKWWAATAPFVVGSADPSDVNGAAIAVGARIADRYGTGVTQLGGRVGEWNAKPDCLAIAALGGSQAALESLGTLSSEYARRYTRYKLYGAQEEASARLFSHYLRCCTLAAMCGAPAGTNPYSATGERWNFAGIARSVYEDTLASQNADGSISLPNSPYFQWGMLNTSLLQFADQFLPSDERARSFSRKLLSWVFNFLIRDETIPFSATDPTRSADDMGFFAYPAAWLARSADQQALAWYSALVSATVHKGWLYGWQADIATAFLWSSPQQSVRNLSVTPQEVSAQPNEPYSFVSTHSGSSSTLSRIFVMVSLPDYSSYLHVMYDLGSDRIWVAENGAWKGGVTAGTAVALSTSNGTVYCGLTKATRSAAQSIQIRWTLSSPSWFSPQRLRLSFFAEGPNAEIGWDALGVVKLGCP